MDFLKKLASFFIIPDDNPDLVRAQIKVFSRQVPLLYGIVLVSSSALAYTHFAYAPWPLVVGVPVVLSSIALVRTIMFARISLEPLDATQMRVRLRSTVRVALGLGLIYTVWALSLYQYGNAYTQGHIVFFSGVTIFGCVACLLHLPSAALSLMLSVVIPFTIFFTLTGIPVFVAISINMVLVAGAVMIVMFGYSRDFANLIDHQSALVAKQEETQSLSDANSRLANLDSLTDLPNRRSFFSELQSRLEIEKTQGGGLAVGILDLDGFKLINDVYGHPTGDRVLTDVGHRLSAMLEENVFVARLGGDEFGLIVAGDLSDADLVAQGGRICQIMRSPFDMNGSVAQMSGSVGIAKYSEDAGTAESLFERADYALYYAKEFSAGSAVLFSKEHEAQIREVSGIERRLRDADLEEEMSLVFQPIVDVASARAVGFEVLARWTSPILGTVPPAAFIRAAERAGLINQLTEILFQKALDAAQDWPDDVFMSFNLSSYDVGAPECILRLKDIIDQTSFSPHRLTFEVTETAVMQDFSRASESLQLLKSMGSSIALDDFGTGYSSLSYVRTLPLDRLKVDRSFIGEIENDNTARSIVQTIIELCANLELDCIVEGVETEGQLAILEKMGCKKIQGYLFSRPMEAANVSKYLAAQQKLKAVG